VLTISSVIISDLFPADDGFPFFRTSEIHMFH
jgi:hypothetical protein